MCVVGVSVQGASGAKHRSDESSRHCSMMHKPLRFNPQAQANLKFKGTMFTQQTHTRLLTAHTLLLTSVGSSLGMMGEQRGARVTPTSTDTCADLLSLWLFSLCFFFLSHFPVLCLVLILNRQDGKQENTPGGWMSRSGGTSLSQGC